MILADTSIKRPVFTIMVVVAMLVLGSFAYNQMAVDLFPDVEFPFVVVTTPYPGAGPEAVESEVTDRIEEQVNTVSGLDHLTSTSYEGLSQVVAQFVIDADPADKALEVREKISTILGELPDDAEDPIIQRFDPESEPIISLLVVSDQRGIKELTTLAKETIKRRLESLEGVGAVQLVGGAEREIQIALDATRLDAFNLSPHDVQTAVQASNVEIPAGRIDRGRSELTLRTLGKYADWRDFRDLVVAHRDGRPVHVSNVADVYDGTIEQRSFSRFDGSEAVALDIVRQTGANTVQVADDVLAQVEQLERELPDDISIEVAYDNSTFIREAVHEVITNMLYGGTLAVIVIFLFLYNWRTTLISALAIPTSVIGTFAFMYVMGFSINFMSLLGLSIAVGLLIDDAIVVMENIYRNFKGDRTPGDAASIGTAEIGMAVFATTMTIVAVFVPVGLMGGIVGRFFMQFGLTVAFAILVSLFIAFTLTPMMFSQLVKEPEGQNNRGKWFGARWLHRFEVRFNATFDRLKERYRKLLAGALRHRFITMLLATVAFFGSLMLISLVGTEFIPKTDQAQFFVEFEAAPGTSLTETARLAGHIEDRINELPEVTNVFTTVGGGQRGVNEGIITAKLVPLGERDRHAADLITVLRDRVESIPGLYTSLMIERAEGGQSRPLNISVQGENLRLLERVAAEVEDSVRAVSGVRDVDNSMVGARPEAQIVVDRNKASDLGLSMGSIASTLRLLVDGDEVTTYKEDDEEYDVRLRLEQRDRSNLWAIENLKIRSTKDIPGSDHFFVPLKQVARIEQRGGPTEIRRYDRRREILISSNIAEGYFAGDVRGAALEKAQTVETPPGYVVKATGEAEIQEESFKNIMIALALAVLFIYFILASQYESFNDPLAIMLSLPMALVGAFAGLFLFGSALSIISFVGIVLLMGLVTKNAILLVDFVKQARARGMSRFDAILESGPIRLRPILMTTLATIFGLLPLALGIGPGAELRAPMARAVIGGMISSTLLTLVVVPVVYSLLDDLKEKIVPSKRGE
ncbi:MAG: MMPL family transporter [candidate division Zixibacteria bacterium]|nr:MMPL family transporter [candidate division Zixibacteria bacterium]